MSRTELVRLHRAHAFDPAPRRAELHELHVPFDDLTGTAGCEAALDRAVRQRQRVGLVGVTGSGKTSVTEYVLGPLVEGVAPLPIPISVESPAVATDPAEFARHVVGLVRRWVGTALPRRAGAAAPPARSPRSRRITVAPEWMGARVELGYELGEAAAQPTSSTAEVVDQARQLLDLIGAHDLVPVLVLDDTDRWLASSWQPEAAQLRAGFFGRVVRVIAEDFASATVLAVHPTYLADPEYQAAGGFVDTTIHVPAIASAAGIGRVLGRRGGLVLGADEDAALRRTVDDGALALLFDHYRTDPNLRRRVLQVAHQALTIAVDAAAEVLTAGHVQIALTETFPPDRI